MRLIIRRQRNIGTTSFRRHYLFFYLLWFGLILFFFFFSFFSLDEWMWETRACRICAREMRVLVSNRCEFTLRDLFKECVQGLKKSPFPMEKRVWVGVRYVRSWGLFSKKRPRDHFCPHKATQRRLWGAFFYSYSPIKKIGLPFTFPSVFILFHRLTFENRSNKNTRKKSLSTKRKEVQIITQAYKHII